MVENTELLLRPANVYRETETERTDPFFESALYDYREDIILGLIELARIQQNATLRSEVQDIYVKKRYELPESMRTQRNESSPDIAQGEQGVEYYVGTGIEYRSFLSSIILLFQRAVRHTPSDS